MLALPVFLTPTIGITNNIPDLYGARPAFVKAYVAPVFPDFASNYHLTVEVPQEQARQAALEAAQAAETVRLAQEVAQATQPSTQAPVAVAGDAKSMIYMRESGNNPKAQNAGGCLGLGQACPGSKLLNVCPNLDYACEDAFFTDYANSRYGGWDAAAAFWRNNSWW